MKIRYFIIAILVVNVAITLNGCKSYVAFPPIEETIFIPDEYYQQLPIYSEKGYNTFGAMFERYYFVVNRNVTPLKMLYYNGNIEMTLSGIRKSDLYTYNDTTRAMSMTFTFPFEECRTYEELIKLHNTMIDLTADGSKVSITVGDESPQKLEITEGEFFVKRAQTLVIDERKTAIILSGTFYFKYKENGSFYVVRNGRFDMSVNNLYFNYIVP